MGALDTFPRRNLSVADFHRMAEAGILGEDDRIGLIDGEIIEMAPIGALHAAQVNLLARLLNLTIEIPLYARHGMAEVWLVDLPGRPVLVYRQPGPEGYGDGSTAAGGSTISPLALPDSRLDTAELWRP